MKRFILLSLLLMSGALVSGGQTKNEVSDKTLCFAYVSHGSETSVNSLVKYLESRYEKALETDDFVFVVYLSDGDTPLIVEVNTESDNSRTSLLFRFGYQHEMKYNFPYTVFHSGSKWS